MPTVLAVVRRAERVAAVFDQPEIVLAREVGDRVQVERIAERVGDHDGARAVGQGRFELRHVDVIRRQFHVDEDRDAAVLNDRVDRGRESRPPR